jgi:hypothetical protein
MGLSLDIGTMDLGSCFCSAMNFPSIAFADTSAAFSDQGGAENVMAANSLITVVFWCDDKFMLGKAA